MQFLMINFLVSNWDFCAFASD